MEQFLANGQGYCITCNTWRWFRISRFGCVFACQCPGKYIEFQSVLRDYVAAISIGERPVEFVPVISGRISTDHMKIAQVELDLIHNNISLRIMNTTPEDAFEIVNGLPISLHKWTKTEEDNFSFSMDSLDLLIHELRLLSDVSGDRLLVNEPSKRCKEVALNSKINNNFSLSDLLPAKLFSALHQHQLEGIYKALNFGGRVLFADEMGVGKTLQAIGTLAALKAFPTLIICPAALRHLWVEEIEKWLTEFIELDDIHIISSSNSFLSVKDSPKIVITSFHMAAILSSQIKNRQWNCIIVDESHTLHTTLEASSDAQYTSLICEIGKRSKYCLFLSGTPSLASPFDLFNQIDTISSGLLGETRYEFALRYCRTEFSPYFKVRECIRNIELFSLLSVTCMVRRLKSETLIDLPSKQRVILRIPETLISTRQKKKITFQEEYSSSWIKKRHKILEIVDFLLEKYHKIVIFAHHIKLLDCLTKHIHEKKFTWIRIDGSTPISSRAISLSLFNEGEIHVAIIGITACAVGIHLTGASYALFAELPPDVTWMQQAEDRLHRPGQEKNVIFFYIIGSGSFFDGELFVRLCRSFQAIRRTTDGVSSSLTASYTSHGVLFNNNNNNNNNNIMNTECDTSRCINTLFNLADSIPLLFRISCNTGRIHITQGDKYLINLSLDEAQQYWNLSDEFSRQLKEFLSNVELLSPFERRRLRLSGVWLKSNFTWRPKKIQRKTFSRYSQERLLLGRVFFWKVIRRNLPTHSYGALLIKSEKGYVPLCLECENPLSYSKNLSPGEVVTIENDTVMFCTGICRESFYIKRSGSAVRRGVRDADKGICTKCQVDCELLCSLISATTSLKDREALIDQMHPQMRQHPILFKRIIENPIPGNFWNADHILPVSQGGGEANMDNLQTLCVACHADKTKSEAEKGHMYAMEKNYLTTVDISCNHFIFKSKRRVTMACVITKEREDSYCH